MTDIELALGAAGPKDAVPGLSTGGERAESNLEPRVALEPGGVVVLKGRRCLVERRIKDRWQLLGVEDKEVHLPTDRELARLQSEGRFHTEWCGTRRFRAPAPPTPLSIGPEAHASNLRKHAYVSACLSIDNLRRSRSLLKPVIRAVAEGRGEKAPGFTTVLNWIDEYERHGPTYGTAAYSDRHDLKGRREQRLLAVQEKAIRIGIDRLLRGGTAPKAYAAVWRFVRLFDAKYGRHLDKTALGPNFVDENGRLRPPSLRTFERRWAAVNPMVRDWARHGPRYASQKYRTYTTTALPDRPFAHVEVDHCTLDVVIIDPSGLVLGRPDLVAFRDRATTMILGYGLGFEQPSYASFLRGLRHAMYPKDLSNFPAIKNPWPCYGRIENLYVDNALHFLGDNILEAGRELGFNVVRLQPREPWLKGALERFFRSANVGIVHELPATTLENVLARRDHENLGEPTLTIEEFEALLCFWICDIYHAGVRRALGPLRGFGGVPLKAWAEKVAKYEAPALPPPEMFTALAGDWKPLTIQRNGITWDYIVYEDANLTRLRAHPDHRHSSERGGSTKYKVSRDPFDLGHVFVLDHHTGEVLEVPATQAHRAYANGKTLHQHQVILNHAKRKLGKDLDFEGLMRASDELSEVVQKLRNAPGRKKVVKGVARFLEADRARRLRSEIRVLEPPGRSSGLLDLGSPEPPSMIVSSSGPDTLVSAEVASAPLDHADPGSAWPAEQETPYTDYIDDLAEIRASRNWRTSHV